MFCDESVAFGKILSFAIMKGNGSQEAREAMRKRSEDMSEVDEKGRGTIWVCRVEVGL